MRFLSPIRSCLQAISIIVFCMMIGLSSAFAQDSLESVTPAFTAQSLEERITALETNADLSNDQRDQIRTALLAAVEQLNEANPNAMRNSPHLRIMPLCFRLIWIMNLRLRKRPSRLKMRLWRR